MRLITAEGVELRLEVLGYQNPAIEDDEWESEWLILSGVISGARAPWRFRDPCLCTFELAELVAWLRELGREGKGASDELGFVEPSLRFECVRGPGGDELLVSFALETAPPWASEDERQEGYVLRFPFRRNDLAAAADSLEGMLARFPVRARTRE